jgi:hypothetical protein
VTRPENSLHTREKEHESSEKKKVSYDIEEWVDDFISDIPQGLYSFCLTVLFVF